MHKEKNISEVLDQMYQKYKLNSKLEEVKLNESWEKIVGPLIFKHTTKIQLKGKTLYVSFDEAVLKNEMFYRREELAKSVNDFFGRIIVEKVFVN